MQPLRPSRSSSTPEICPSVVAGRQDNPEFPSNEKLYRRLVAGLYEDGSPRLENFCFKDDNPEDPGKNISVNREIYSAPECAICPYQCPPKGRNDDVYEFSVNEVRSPSTDLGIQASYPITADLLHKIVRSRSRKNYAHSEVRLFNGRLEVGPNVNTTVIENVLAEHLAMTAKPSAVEDPHTCEHFLARRAGRSTSSPDDPSRS